MELISEIKWRLRYFKESIIKLFRWFPIIVKDKDYDYWFIYEILKFKLTTQYEHLINEDEFINTQHYVGKLKTCIKLIELLQDEKYIIERLNMPESEYFKKYPSIYRKAIKKYGSANPIRCKIFVSTYNHNRARKLLFSILEKYIENWWD
jgi:hypothetical protein